MCNVDRRLQQEQQEQLARLQAQHGPRLAALFQFPDTRGCNSGETRVSSIREGLFLGGSDVAKDVAWHLASGTQLIINMAGGEVVLPARDLQAAGVAIHEYAVADTASGAAHLRVCLPKAALLIDETLQRGKDGPAAVVLVHCAAGMSRSASAVIYYLMAHHGLSLLEAWEAVRAARPFAYPNLPFLRTLMALEQKLRPGVPSSIPEEALALHPEARQSL